MISDPYILRREVERLVSEDRVPTDELKRLFDEYSDVSARLDPRRPLPRRSAGILAGTLRRAGRTASWFRRSGPEIPAAVRLNGAEAIEVLFNAADDAELTTLDELVERAGLGWRCQAEVAGFPCDYMNVGASHCGGCGAAESKGKEDRDG